MLVGQDTARFETLDDLLGPDLMHALDRVDVLSRKMFPGKLPGERRSKKRGQSVEFDDYRQYVPGDDLRHIDWNVFARLDKFFIKLFREEEDLAVHVLLDLSASMDAGRPSKRALALRLGMALAYVGLVNQNRVIVSAFGSGEGLVRLGAVRGRRGARRVGQFLLERAADRSPTTGGGVMLGEATRALALSRQGKGVVFLVSDLLDQSGWSEGLGYLASGHGYDTAVLQVLAPDELNPESARDRGLVGDLRLTDAETGLGREVTVTAAAIRRYRERLGAHLDAVARRCRSLGMTHRVVRSDADPAAVILGDLRRSGAVG